MKVTHIVVALVLTGVVVAFMLPAAQRGTPITEQTGVLRIKEDQKPREQAQVVPFPEKRVLGEAVPVPKRVIASEAHSIDQLQPVQIAPITRSGEVGELSSIMGTQTIVEGYHPSKVLGDTLGVMKIDFSIEWGLHSGTGQYMCFAVRHDPTCFPAQGGTEGDFLNAWPYTIVGAKVFLVDFDAGGQSECTVMVCYGATYDCPDVASPIVSKAFTPPNAYNDPPVGTKLIFEHIYFDTPVEITNDDPVWVVLKMADDITMATDAGCVFGGVYPDYFEIGQHREWKDSYNSMDCLPCSFEPTDPSWPGPGWSNHCLGLIVTDHEDDLVDNIYTKDLVNAQLTLYYYGGAGDTVYTDLVPLGESIGVYCEFINNSADSARGESWGQIVEFIWSATDKDTHFLHWGTPPGDTGWAGGGQWYLNIHFDSLHCFTEPEVGTVITVIWPDENQDTVIDGPDDCPGNDTLVLSLYPPPDSCDITCRYQPRPGPSSHPGCMNRIIAIFENYGSSLPDSVPVYCDIDGIPHDTQYISGHRMEVEFDGFIPGPVGTNSDIATYSTCLGDTNYSNDTLTIQSTSDTCAYWDDGAYENIWTVMQDGSRMGVDFFCPCDSCFIHSVEWMVYADWPDAERETLGIQIWAFDCVEDTPTVILWDTSVVSQEVEPFFNAVPVPPIQPPCCHFLVAIEMTEDTCEGIMADGEPYYWNHDWSGSAGNWNKGSFGADLAIRACLWCYSFPRDVAVWSIDLPGPSAIEQCPNKVQATIGSMGSLPSGPFQVTCTIDGYGDTVNIPNLAPGASQTIDFNDWTPPGAGAYTMTVITHLAIDENHSNDTMAVTVEAGVEVFWDDDDYDAAWIWWPECGRFAQDFFTPCCTCTIVGVKWMIHPDWPDVQRELVELEIYEMPNDTPAITPMWSTQVVSTDTAPFWNYVDTDPLKPTTDLFLVAFHTVVDTSEALCIDDDQPLWGHDWSKDPGEDWTGPEDRGNWMLRAVVWCADDDEAFIRGDCTGPTPGYGDGYVVMSDVIYILKYCYVPGTPPPSCMDALDINDNGEIDCMTEAMYLLRHLYMPGPPPPPPPYGPFPDCCGPDPTLDDLDCQDHPCQHLSKASPATREVDGEMLFGDATIQDEKIIVPVYLENNRPLSGFAYTVSYDPTVLSFKSADNTSLVTGNFDFFSARPDEEIGSVSVGGVIDMGLKTNLTPGYHEVTHLIFELKTDKLEKTVLEFSDVELVDTEARPLSAHTNTCTIRIPFSIPKVFGLSQNYPNPVTNRTAIRYQLPKSTHTTLKIYNSAGQVVRTLVDEVKNPGYYSEIWNGKDNLGRQVSSGVYFYQLKTDEYTRARKLVVVQ